MKLETFQFAGQSPTHWAAPVRANFYEIQFIIFYFMFHVLMYFLVFTYSKYTNIFILSFIIEMLLFYLFYLGLWPISIRKGFSISN